MKKKYHKLKKIQVFAFLFNFLTDIKTFFSIFAGFFGK